MNTPKRDHILRAIAERARGRSRIKSTTVAVSLASVATAGVVTPMLPGSHTSGTSSSQTSTSSGSSGSTGSSSGTNSSGSASTGSGSTSTGSWILWLVQFQLLGLRSQQRVVRAVVEFGQQPCDVRRLLTSFALSGLPGTCSEQAQRNLPASAATHRRGLTI